MIDEGLTSHLIWTAVAIGLLAAWVAWRDLPLPWAIGLAVVRVAVPLFYFAWYYNPEWNLLDDLIYFSHGDYILDRGYNPLTLLLDPGGIDLLCALNSGHHILYSWWNVLAAWVFGSHYYAPVFMNVLVSFGMGWLFVRTLQKLGFAGKYCNWMLVFLLIHWDTIAWSSFEDIKDIIVETLTIACLFCALSFHQERRLRWLAGMGAICFLFYWIRFYVPLLMVGAMGMWMLWEWPDPRKYILLPLAIVAINLPLPAISEYTDSMSLQALTNDFGRFCLTPLPWKIEVNYTFLTIPSILHMAMFLPAIIGAIMLWRECPGARLYLIYLLGAIVFYSATEELQGPRQRVQVSFILAWAQFHFIRHALRLPIWRAKEQVDPEPKLAPRALAA